MKVSSIKIKSVMAGFGLACTTLSVAAMSSFPGGGYQGARGTAPNWNWRPVNTMSSSGFGKMGAGGPRGVGAYPHPGVMRYGWRRGPGMANGFSSLRPGVAQGNIRRMGAPVGRNMARSASQAGGRYVARRVNGQRYMPSVTYRPIPSRMGYIQRKSPAAWRANPMPDAHAWGLNRRYDRMRHAPRIWRWRPPVAQGRSWNRRSAGYFGTRGYRFRPYAPSFRHTAPRPSYWGNAPRYVFRPMAPAYARGMTRRPYLPYISGRNRSVLPVVSNGHGDAQGNKGFSPNSQRRDRPYWGYPVAQVDLNTLP